MTQEEKVKVNQAINVIVDSCNGWRTKDIAEVIYERISREHRTLQQAFWSTLLLTQIKYADNDSDLRNEQAVQLACKVKELARQLNFDYGLSYL